MSKGYGKAQRFILERMRTAEKGAIIDVHQLAEEFHGHEPTSAQTASMRKSVRGLVRDGHIRYMDRGGKVRTGRSYMRETRSLYGETYTVKVGISAYPIELGESFEHWLIEHPGGEHFEYRASVLGQDVTNSYDYWQSQHPEGTWSQWYTERLTALKQRASAPSAELPPE